MMDGDVGALDSSIQSARLEVTRDQDAVVQAASLQQISTEVERHDRDMGDIMGGMDSRMGGMMSRCSGAGMGVMHDRMGTLASEMRSYDAALKSAATLTDARAACTAHARRVNGMLDDMQRSLGNVGCMSMMGR
jgi:hypothetical protein